MKPWIIDRIERERQRQEDQRRQPALHIPTPPREWVDEQERKERAHRDESAERGVWIFEM